MFFGEKILRSGSVRSAFVVHSGFHTVLNLQADPAKPLLSLVTCLEAMGPNALLVTGGPGLETFEIASALSFEANSLRVGPLSIDCSQVKRPSLISRSDGQKRGVQRRVRKWVEAQAPGLTSVRSHLTNQLAEGLLTEDEDLVRSALAGFIGQGMGLTPSGDDFVAGVLLAYVKGFSASRSSKHIYFTSACFSGGSLVENDRR